MTKLITIISSVLISIGPKKYNRIPTTIRLAITQASKRVACVTVITGYCLVWYLSSGPNG
jgi:hypothetical protein